jgi:hypothetical protein
VTYRFTVRFSWLTSRQSSAKRFGNRRRR